MSKAARSSSTPSRTSGTASRRLDVRRMDSLARLVHSYKPRTYGRGHDNPVVTAVGFEPLEHASGSMGRPRLLVAHNTSSGPQRDVDFERLGQVADVLHGVKSAREVAASLSADSGLPGARGHRRILRDLRKLRKTFRGKDSHRVEEGGKWLHDTLHAAFDTGESYRDLTLEGSSGAIHGETALLAQSVPGPIGVSKLSCHECFEYGRRMRRSEDLRGSHAQSFPGWEDPESGEVSRFRRYSSSVNQYASDSESDSGSESDY